MEKYVQVDLFEQLDQQSRIKKRLRYPHRKIFPYGFVNIRLSYENIIFSLIVLLLLCVILFSLGIERGKNLRYSYLKQNKLTLETNLSNPSGRATGTQAISGKTNSHQSLYVKTATPLLSVTQQKQGLESVKYKYTIQVFTYKDRNLAMKRTEQLARNGYKPFIIYYAGLYQICLGKYLNRESAQKDLMVLSKNYKDCLIRNMP